MLLEPSFFSASIIVVFPDEGFPATITLRGVGGGFWEEYFSKNSLYVA